MFEDPYEACDGAHAIAVLTEWDEFKDYDWHKIYSKCSNLRKIFDGRNVLDHKLLKEIGFQVNGIGV